MEAKKNPKADLESKRSLFFQLGLIVAFGSSLAAFEWSNSEVVPSVLGDSHMLIDEVELPPLTVRKEQKIELPKIKLTDIIVIVDDNKVIVEDAPVIENEDYGQTVDLTLPATGGEEEEGDPIPFVFLETKPEFPGGMDALTRYVASQIRYPVICAETGIQGTVYVSFVIDKVGHVTDVKILRGVHPAIDNEAVRVISGMPNWSPGKQRDIPVKVSFNMPVKFLLQ